MIKYKIKDNPQSRNENEVSCWIEYDENGQVCLIVRNSTGYGKILTLTDKGTLKKAFVPTYLPFKRDDNGEIIIE